MNDHRSEWEWDQKLDSICKRGGHRIEVTVAESTIFVDI